MSTSGRGPYFLHIERLPRRYTWQDLKDLIRRQAAHGIWTDMAVYPNGQSGGKGYARVQRVEEANRLYEYLTQNRIENELLRVHLWDISGTPAVFQKCNCGATPQSHPPNTKISEVGQGAGWQIFSAATSPTSMVQPSLYPPPAPVPQMAPSSMQPPPAQQLSQQQLIFAMSKLNLSYPRANLDPRNPSHVQFVQQSVAAQQAQQIQQYQPQVQAGAQYPLYVSNGTGLPTNASQGVIRTEARGIFVNGLNYKTRTKDIETQFSKAGDVVKVTLQKDIQTGKSKGNATVEYASSEAAQRAIDMFHGKSFQGMRLNVRRDKEATAINAPGDSNGQKSARRATEQPTIANGSQPQMVQIRKDSVVSSK